MEASINHWSVLMRRKWTVLITTLCAAFVGFTVACFRAPYYSRVIMEIEQEPPVCGMIAPPTSDDLERWEKQRTARDLFLTELKSKHSK